MACQSQPSRILRHLALNVDEHLTGRNAGQRCAWLDVLVAMAGADVLVVVLDPAAPDGDTVGRDLDRYVANFDGDLVIGLLDRRVADRKARYLNAVGSAIAPLPQAANQDND